MHGKLLVDTEINIQLGTLTLNTSQLQVLDETITRVPDFRDIFSDQAKQMQMCSSQNHHQASMGVIGWQEI